MANALIGKQNDDGSVTGIYCHMHGAPGETGRILMNTCNDAASVDALLERGHTPSLVVDSAESMRVHNAWCRSNWQECVAGSRPLYFSTFNDFVDVATDKCFFAYIFKNNKWQYASLERRSIRFQSITQACTAGFHDESHHFRLRRREESSGEALETK